MRRERTASEGADAADGASIGPAVRLLRSKLAPPPAPKGIAPRGQLLDRLREGRGRRLTLVCAPAGYGKTTVLAQWLEADRERTPFAWMSDRRGRRGPGQVLEPPDRRPPGRPSASRDGVGRGAARRARLRREHRPPVARRGAVRRTTVRPRRRRLAPRSKHRLRRDHAHPRRAGTPGRSGRALRPLRP
jgi:hypothetical protein